MQASEMENLQKRALALAREQLNFTSSVKEIAQTMSSGVSRATTADLSDPNIWGDTADGRALAASNGVWLSVLDCWDNGISSHVLSPSQRTALESVVKVARTLLDEMLFCSNHILHCFKKQLPHVPVEVLMTLIGAQIITLQSLLQECPVCVQYLVSAIASLGCEESRQERVQKYIMQCLAEELCILVMRQYGKAVEVIKLLPQAILVNSLPTISFLRCGVSSPAINSSTAAEVGEIMLSSLLAVPNTLSVLEILSLQSDWSYSSLPKPATCLYSDIILVLGTTNFINFLHRTLSGELLNWQVILQIVVCFLHHDPSSPTLLTEFVEQLLLNGLEEGDRHILTCALVLSRQASLEGSHLFPTYDQWLQSVFIDRGNSFVRTKKILIFLLKTLTAFVPYEPVFALKAHVAHSPRHLTKSLTELNDYLSLATTRLNDLGEKIATSDTDTNSDVVDAIEHFNKTGTISNVVRQASIFRKPYFVGRFLPQLLRPSIDCVLRDQFIDALTRENMIPARTMRRYKRECHTLGSKETVCVSENVTSLLAQLSSLVKDNKSVTKLLSNLSLSLGKETNHQSSLTTVELVEDIMSFVFQSIIINWQNHSDYRWVGELLAMLSGHCILHQPLYLRLSELLTSQMVELQPVQLMCLAVILSHSYTLSPNTPFVLDCNDHTVSTWRDCCLSLLSRLTPNTVLQTLKFSCFFVEQLFNQNTSQEVPFCLLKLMVYIYQREKCLQHFSIQATVLESVLKAVDKLLEDNVHFHQQWNDCKISFETWLSLELTNSDYKESHYCRQNYRWRKVYINYGQSSSLCDIFSTLFKALAHSNTQSSEFHSILLELSWKLIDNGAKHLLLLHTLQDILSPGCSADLASSAVLLAVSLPPLLLFLGCQGSDIAEVAQFVQNKISPLFNHLMILPIHITSYLLQGAKSLGEGAVENLCNASPTFLSSLMVHVPLLTSYTVPDSVLAMSQWIHSGMEGPLPSTDPRLLPSLSLAVWHTAIVNITSLHLLRLPLQMIVMMAHCSLYWLSSNSTHHLSTPVENILQSCVEVEPSAVEIFVPLPSQLPDFVEIQHSQLITEFRNTFSCPSSPHHSLTLIKLAGHLSCPVLEKMMTDKNCFFWLCVTAHADCVSLSIPLPHCPVLHFPPLSVEYLKETKSTITKLVHLAKPSMLQNIQKYCHSQLKPLIISRLNLRL